MRDKSFLDTNILVYAYDSSEKEKHPKASRFLKDLWSSQYHFHFWDAMIFAAGKEANVSRIYTEDFQHNLEIEGIKFINPFK